MSLLSCLFSKKKIKLQGDYIMRNYRAEIENLKKQAQRPMLQKILEDRIYEHDLAELNQLAKDKGYTKEWLNNQIVELNKLYLEISEKALEDYNDKLSKLEQQVTNINNTNFEHNYTSTDYADLQFLQTLIKSRLLNESQNNPVIVERILKEYINTQKGARAITFLADDKEIGELIKGFYRIAYINAQSPAEKKFNASKETELNKLNKDIVKMTQTAIIGQGNLRVAKERVQADELARANSAYWN